MAVPCVRIVGRGRAGTSLASALAAVGWRVETLGRGDPVAAAAEGVDAVVIATPDDVIALVASSIVPVPDTVVLHMAGSRGLDELLPHRRRASLHPLASLPDAHVGARRLAAGATFAVAGDAWALAIVDALGGSCFEVPDDRRAAYHAACCIACNHLVALMAQVERVASSADVPFGPLLQLARDTLENVQALGPRASLTGPAARGDVATLASHLAALDADEHSLYSALAREAGALAGRGPVSKAGPDGKKGTQERP